MYMCVMGKKCVHVTCVCVCEEHVYVAWAVLSQNHMSAGLQSEKRKRRRGEERRGIHGGRMDEGGMPFHLQLPLPHSHFSAHEWGEGCVCVSSLYLHAWSQAAHSWSKPHFHLLTDVRFYSYFHDGFSVLVSFQMCLGISEGQVHSQYTRTIPELSVALGAHSDLGYHPLNEKRIKIINIFYFYFILLSVLIKNADVIHL